MKARFWECPSCESEQPISAAVCATCSLSREPDELTGSTHVGHMTAALTNRNRWRIASVGLGYVVIAARSRTIAEQKGAQLLKQDARADQRVVVTDLSRRGWLVYVRSELIPYPSALEPWRADGAVRNAPDGSLPPREPVKGRTYIGQVLVWFSDKGQGSIYCADRRIGVVAVRRSDLDGRQEAAMHTGQHVSFMIKKMPDGMFATDIRLLG